MTAVLRLLYESHYLMKVEGGRAGERGCYVIPGTVALSAISMFAQRHSINTQLELALWENVMLMLLMMELLHITDTV